MFQIGVKKLLRLKKSEKKRVKKNCKKINQTKFRVEKVIKKKENKFYVKWKGYDSFFNSWINEEGIFYKISYFPEPHIHSKNKIEVELELSN